MSWLTEIIKNELSSVMFCKAIPASACLSGIKEYAFVSNPSCRMVERLRRRIVALFPLQGTKEGERY